MDYLNLFNWKLWLIWTFCLVSNIAIKIVSETLFCEGFYLFQRFSKERKRDAWNVTARTLPRIFLSALYCQLLLSQLHSLMINNSKPVCIFHEKIWVHSFNRKASSNRRNFGLKWKILTNSHPPPNQKLGVNYVMLRANAHHNMALKVVYVYCD